MTTCGFPLQVETCCNTAFRGEIIENSTEQEQEVSIQSVQNISSATPISLMEQVWQILKHGFW